MKAAILSFTANGRKTAGKVRKALSSEDWLVAENVKCKEEADSYEGSLKEWTGEHWKVSDVLIYVGAAGIAVRAVASFVLSLLLLFSDESDVVPFSHLLINCCTCFLYSSL